MRFLPRPTPPRPRRRRPLRGAAALALPLALLGSSPPSPASLTGAAATAHRVAPGGRPATGRLVLDPAHRRASGQAPAAAESGHGTGRVWALVRLEGDGAIVRARREGSWPGSDRGRRRESAATPGWREALAGVIAEQTLLRDAIERVAAETARGAERPPRITGALRLTGNALAVDVAAADLGRLAALPGVREVVPDRLGHLDTALSAPFVGAAAAWAGAPGATGQGLTIGVIDTGIDYTHAHFGGSGDPAVYAAQSVAPASATVADIGFDGSKVASGFDFVGDAWPGAGPPTGSGGSPLGSSWVLAAGDDDPIDCNGHGTHVAGIAAGYGVTAGGSTFAGPWDAAIPFLSMRVGPGVAPEATLHALKIGGCSPAVSWIAAALALEVAVDPDGDGDTADHLDVVNASFGEVFGSPHDALVEAVEAVSAAGVLVVGTAGNDGDTYFAHGGPAVAEAAIAVANSTADRLHRGLEIASGPPGVYPAYPATIAARLNSFGALGVFGPLGVKIAGGSVNDQGCALADFAGFGGEAALIEWTAAPPGCSSSVRMQNAVDAGGVGGLVFVSANPADSPFVPLACLYGGGMAPLPCVSVTATDGAHLLAGPAAFTVRFDDALRALLPFSIADRIAATSSRGPRIAGAAIGETLLKPDLAAPGELIQSASRGSGTFAEPRSGTSMAAPHVAGAAALLLEAHPAWSVGEIKALLLGSALADLWTADGQTGDRFAPSRAGSGRLDLAAALATQTIAFDAAHPERVSVSFGRLEVVGALETSRSVTVRNLGAVPRAYSLAFLPRQAPPGVSFAVSPSALVVPGFGEAAFEITLAADPGAMAGVNAPDPTTPAVQTGVFGSQPRHRLLEASGHVLLAPIAPDDSSPVRIAVHAAPRPASAMHAAPLLGLPEAIGPGASILPLTGQGFATGPAPPADVLSLATAFQLAGQDPVSQPAERASADLAAVGVASDYRAALALCGGDAPCAIANTTVWFALAVHGEWSPATGGDAWFDIGVDRDDDGILETTVFNGDSASVVGAAPTDTALAWATDGESFLDGSGALVEATFLNGIAADTLETYLLSNEVMVLPVAAARLGLTPLDTGFRFRVRSFARDPSGAADYVLADTAPPLPGGWWSHDLATAPYGFQDLGGILGGPFLGLSFWADREPGGILVDHDLAGPGAPPPLLVLHHHNARAAGRVEIVPVARTAAVDAAIEKTADDETPGEGQPVLFTLTLRNRGPAPLVDPVIVDTLPAGLDWIADTCPGLSSSAPVPGGTAIHCDLAGVTLLATQSLAYTVTAAPAAGTAGAVLTNSVAVAGMADGLLDGEPANDRALVDLCVGSAFASCAAVPAVEIPAASRLGLAGLAAALAALGWRRRRRRRAGPR